MDRLTRVEERLEVEKSILNGKLESMEKIDEKMKQLTGLDAKVVYMRDVERKKLQEIADEIGYSYDYIKEVSARNKTHL